VTHLRVRLSAIALIVLGATTLASPRATAAMLPCYLCIGPATCGDFTGWCTANCPEHPSGTCVDVFALCGNTRAIVCEYDT
jgi:hypothetical protein